MTTDVSPEFDEGLVLDLSGIEDSAPMEALRAGTYDVEVMDVEYTTSKKGSPMLKWVFQGTDPEIENRRFWNYTVLDNEIGQRIARDSIIAIDPEFDLSGFRADEVGESLAGRPCRVTVGVEKVPGQDRKSNPVKRVLPPSGDAGEFLS